MRADDAASSCEEWPIAAQQSDVIVTVVIVTNEIQAAVHPASVTLAGLGAVPSNEHSWDEILHDGPSVHMREIRKQDLELERQFIERLSP